MNLKVILKHLDLGNLELYESVRENETERKDFEHLLGYVLPLWISGALNGRDQVRLLSKFNEQINIGWWESDSHPELRAKLLAAIGTGQVIQHDYHARPTRRRMTMLMTLLSQRYPDIRDDEVRLWCSVNSEAILLEWCRNYGIQEQDREPIVNEYRNLV